jgi:hypothetical protein
MFAAITALSLVGVVGSERRYDSPIDGQSLIVLPRMLS